MAESNRRGFLTRAPAAAAAVVAVTAGSSVGAQDEPKKKKMGKKGKKGKRATKQAHWPGREAPPEDPLFSPVVTLGDMVFLSGLGAHFEGDVKAHTAHVLDEMKKNLEAVGSSMEKVLKVNV